MSRKPRHYVPGIPCHIVQRGNNRTPCFFADDDYHFYLECLGGALVQYRCDLHAYVLMSNHVHLLMTPGEGGSVSRVMQSVGRRYVQYINQCYQRTGTLWEGRHKSSLIDSDHYLLACYRYIELNPVRARMVDTPEQYRWSSYRKNACGYEDSLITEHSEYAQLGRAPEERREMYQALFGGETMDADFEALRSATDLNVPVGNDRFREMVEKQLRIRISYRRRGRPSKEIGK